MLICSSGFLSKTENNFLNDIKTDLKNVRKKLKSLFVFIQ